MSDKNQAEPTSEICMKSIAGILLTVLIASLTSVVSQAAGSACTYYKVSTSLLNISKDIGGGIYIDVLEGGEIACVSNEQKVGSRDWGFISHKIRESDGNIPVNGWSLLRDMKKLSAEEATAAGATLDVAVAVPAPTAPIAQPQKAPELAEAPSVPDAAADVLLFDQPVPFGPFPVNGKSLKELAEMVPLFPPIEGLEKALWEKNCSTCHKWDKQRLCHQGGTYAKLARYVLRHQHPFGGAYKIALMKWAKSGCN